jgi:hypothetical protein
MRSVFDLHPAAVTGRLLAGQPIPGPAQRDAEPEQEVERAARRLPRPRLAFRSSKPAAARSVNA